MADDIQKQPQGEQLEIQFPNDKNPKEASKKKPETVKKPNPKPKNFL